MSLDSRVRGDHWVGPCGSGQRPEISWMCSQMSGQEGGRRELWEEQG